MLPEDAFLRRRQAATLTSVYPSTTAAATTSLYTGLSPAEHGWLGWSCYFKEYARQVDLFLDRDSYTQEKLPASPARALMPFESVFSRIRRAAGGRVQTRAVFPFDPGFTGMDELRIARTPEEAALAVRALTAGWRLRFSTGRTRTKPCTSTARTVKGRAAPLCGLTPGRRRWPRAFGTPPSSSPPTTALRM
jgi:hypothetical protein